MEDYNVPSQVILDEARRTVVGRCIEKTEKGDIFVLLHSSKLPYMLSRQHSALMFDLAKKQWTVEDMKSLNGIYINKKRMKPSLPTQLREGDELCFGAHIPMNELKYIFSLVSGKATLLKRRQDVTTKSPHNGSLVVSNTNYSGGEMSTVNNSVAIQMEAGIIKNSLKRRVGDCDTTPPVRKRVPGDVRRLTPKRIKMDRVHSRTPLPPPAIRPLNIASGKSYIQLISEEQANSSVPSTFSSSQYDHHLSPNTLSDNSCLQNPFVPPLSASVYLPQPPSTSPPQPSSTSPPQPSSTSQPPSTSSPQPPSTSPPQPSSTSQPQPPSTSPPQCLSSVPIPPLASLPVSKPSPAVSCSSTESKEVDNLFDSIVCNSGSWMLDDALFGGGGRSAQVVPVNGDKSTMDGAAIQVLLAKDEMEREKHQLLSSIKALQSELIAKNDVIAKKEEEERKKKDESKVVSSMKEEFTCVICQDLFINAHTLPCAHSFCEMCIKEWMRIKIQKECPICRKCITSNPVHSIVLDNAISKLEVELREEEKQERTRSKEYHKTSRLCGTGKRMAGMSLCHPISGGSGNQSGNNFVIVIGTPPREVNSVNNPIELNSNDGDDLHSELCSNCGRRGHFQADCPWP